MTDTDLKALSHLAGRLVEQSLSRGVSVAEASARQGWELSTRVRLGKVELLSEAGHSSVSLRVMREGRVATTATSDTSEAGLNRAVEDVLELLEVTEPDAFAGPADEPPAKFEPDSLELFDPSLDQLDAARAVELAQELERAALDSDPRLSLSEGASVARVTGASALVLSTGFSSTQRGSYVSLSAAPVAVDEKGKRHRGSYYSARRHYEDLATPAAVGAEAARRALRQLGTRKTQSTQVPVIFEYGVARSLLGALAGGISGGALWRKSSYLLDRLNTQVASPHVTLRDDPLQRRGPSSRAFDGEGLASRQQTVVENGVLKTYLLDSYSGRKLGMPSTHSASRTGASVSAGATNLILTPGTMTLDELIRDTHRGLLVTDLMGFGYNAITGDFSRGATGLWIENGELAYPVSELTLSGNLDDMLKSIDAIANDVHDESSIQTPSFRIARMTVGGE